MTTLRTGYVEPVKADLVITTALMRAASADPAHCLVMEWLLITTPDGNCETLLERPKGIPMGMIRSNAITPPL